MIDLRRRGTDVVVHAAMTEASEVRATTAGLQILGKLATIAHVRLVTIGGVVKTLREVATIEKPADPVSRAENAQALRIIGVHGPHGPRGNLEASALVGVTRVAGMRRDHFVAKRSAHSIETAVRADREATLHVNAAMARLQRSVDLITAVVKDLATIRPVLGVKKVDHKVVEEGILVDRIAFVASARIDAIPVATILDQRQFVHKRNLLGHQSVR